MEHHSLFNRLLIGIMISVLLITQTGCIRYYHLKQVKDRNRVSNYLRKADHKFIHIGEKVIQVQSLDYDPEARTLTGLQEPVEGEILALYTQAKKDGGNTRLEDPMKVADYYQLHYIVSDAKINGDVVIIHQDDLIETQYLKAYSKGNSKMGIAGQVGSVVVLTGVGVGALGLIILAIACACPHVYIYDGESYQRNSNAFVGSVSKKLEASDYSVLESSSSAELKVKIRNEEKLETQYFNQAKLLEIRHGKSVEVLPDQQGNFYTIKKAVSPLENIESLNARGDFHSYSFTELSDETNLSEIEFSFPREKGTNQGKLILSTKNTAWASYVMQEWYKLFGSEIDAVKEKNAKRSTATQLKWQQQQGISLSVYLKEKGKWKYQSTVQVVGNTVNKDLIIPINISDIESNEVEIKLVAGFQLWEIDYAAMDFSEEEPIAIQEISPSRYNLDDEEKAGTALEQDDELYEVLEYGSEISLNFNKLPPTENEEITHILQLKGYYSKESIQKGEYKKRELISFRKKAQMSRFSYYLMQKEIKTLAKK